MSKFRRVFLAHFMGYGSSKDIKKCLAKVSLWKMGHSKMTNLGHFENNQFKFRRQHKIFSKTRDTFPNYQLFLNLCLGRVRESRNNLTWHQFLHVFFYLDVWWRAGSLSVEQTTFLITTPLFEYFRLRKPNELTQG